MAPDRFSFIAIPAAAHHDTGSASTDAPGVGMAVRVIVVAAMEGKTVESTACTRA